MAESALIGPVLTEAEMPPTEDELPYDDGVPMETQRHVLQMYLLMEPLYLYWAERDDFFVGGNMFVYFSPEQVRNYDFRGPDVFVALDVPRRERKSWLVWQEGKGPDVVVELLSESTAVKDKTEKKQIYQDRLRVPEYFWFDPFSGELAGFSLRNGQYISLEFDDRRRLISRQLQLALVHWQGVFQGVEAPWLRWATLEGDLLPTQQEAAEQERERAEQERERAEQERERAEQERERAEQERERAEQERERAEQEREHAAELEARLARYRERFGDLPE
jgi:Uma2 family endonuclease